MKSKSMSNIDKKGLQLLVPSQDPGLDYRVRTCLVSL